MSVSRETWTMAVAALLHDIGKVRQRAGAPLDERTRALEATCCPSGAHGEATHLHVLHTHQFLTDIAESLPDGIDRETVAGIAARHHRPHTREDRILQRADRMSAGADRSPREYEAQGRYWAVALRSVFDKVRALGQEPPPDHVTTHGLQVLSPEAGYPEAGDRPLTREDYQRLWEPFEEETRALKGLKPEAFVEGLLAILLRHCWCVPASTVDEPDVSLYDHAVTTAAFACALLAGGDAVPAGQPALALVGGDVSGIQDYIFDLRQERVKGGSRLLRARSFEIQLLSEATARHLLEAADLPITQRILDAGGRFLLLLPNEPAVLRAVEAAAVRVEGWCFERYEGRLAMVVTGPVVAHEEQFDRHELPATWGRLEAASRAAKQRKHQRWLRAGGDWNPDRAILSADYDAFREGNGCGACGVRPALDDDENGLCRGCGRLARVGRVLPHAARLAWCRSRAVGGGGAALDFFGDALSVSCLREQDPDPRDPFLIQGLGDAWRPGQGLRQAIHFLPRKGDGEPKTFEDLAAEGFRSIRGERRGVPHLAMLKMDVDGMGEVFREGLGDDWSIGRLATMSRMLDTFFSRGLHRILAAGFPSSYTVFAGGDDLCIVGPWDKTFALAPAIRAEFARFTGGNPALHLSAGLALAASGLPVPAMADEAEAALACAKAEGKNRVRVYGTTVPWSEWALVEDWIAFLDKGLQQRDDDPKRGLSRGLIRSLFWFRDRALAGEGRVRLTDSPWRAQLRYQLARNVAADDRPLRERLEKLAGFGSGAASTWRLLRVPVSHVLYRHRKGGNRE